MAKLEKAQLIEMEADEEKPGGKRVTVQFNPDTMKVTFANQIVQPQGGDQSSGPTGRQFVGKGTTKLALTLWFDVTAMVEKPVDDVRRLTGEVIFFMTPQEFKEDRDKLVPPGVRFSWGSFIFDGSVEGLEESLEFFSEDGKPLRASLSLTLSQQKILVSKFGDNTAKAQPGLKPLTSAKAGDTVQSVAGAQGKSGGDWRGVAAANGIEDPLRLQPGQLLDLDAKASSSATLGLSAGSAQASLAAATPRFGVTTGAPRLDLN